MQANSWQIFHFHMSFWICWKEGKNSQKFGYLENEKSFFDEIKKTVFEELSFENVKKKKKIW